MTELTEEELKRATISQHSPAGFQREGETSPVSSGESRLVTIDGMQHIVRLSRDAHQRIAVSSEDEEVVAHLLSRKNALG